MNIKRLHSAYYRYVWFLRYSWCRRSLARLCQSTRRVVATHRVEPSARCVVCLWWVIKVVFQFVLFVQYLMSQVIFISVRWHARAAVETHSATTRLKCLPAQADPTSILSCEITCCCACLAHNTWNSSTHTRTHDSRPTPRAANAAWQSTLSTTKAHFCSNDAWTWQSIRHKC